MSMSGCREVEKYMFDYLEGNLDNRIKASVEAHLAVCEACRSELERCRGMLALLASAKVTPPDGFAASVTAKLAAAKTQSDRAQSDGLKNAKVLAPRRPFRFRYGTVAAAVLLFAVIAVGWRVLPAFMPSTMSKSDSAALENEAAAEDGSSSTEALEYSMDIQITAGSSGDTGADGGETVDAETGEPNGMLMFAAPSNINGDEASGGGGETDAADNSGEAADDDQSSSDELTREYPATEKFGAMTLTADAILAQYAPVFEGKATEVVLIHTESPVYERPYASARVDGEGYTAFLIDTNDAVIAAAEQLAAELGGETCGESGGGLVWIEIYG